MLFENQGRPLLVVRIYALTTMQIHYASLWKWFVEFQSFAIN